LNSVSDGSTRRDPKIARAVGAVGAFRCLGSSASLAIPDLTQILHDPRAVESRERAASVLGFLGKDALPSLVTVLTNEHTRWLRIYALQGIAFMGTNAHSTIPVLLKHLRDDDEAVALNLAAILTRLEPEPDEVIPALVETLQDSRSSVRSLAAFYLGRFGASARSAAPSLIHLLNDADPNMRALATNALRAIDLHSFAEEY